MICTVSVMTIRRHSVVEQPFPDNIILATIDFAEVCFELTSVKYGEA